MCIRDRTRGAVGELPIMRNCQPQVSVSQSDIQSSVQEMLAHLKMVHMELDKVADMAAEMFKTKLFDAKTCVSSKLCKFSWHL